MKNETISKNPENREHFLGIRLSNKDLLKLKDIMIDTKTRNQSKAIRYCIDIAFKEVE